MDDDILRLTSTAVGKLEQSLGLLTLTAQEKDELVGFSFVSLAGCTLERVPGKNNWIEQEGGLPEYICEVARSIHNKRGKSISNAIQIAIGVIKNWAHGRGDVNADTRAKASAALAQWTKMKASAKGKK